MVKIAAISIADYCEATAGMPHDAERLYFRMILKMLAREGGLPDDDAENARIFGYDRRVFARLKAKLLAWPNAVYLEDGLLKNARVENDIAAFKAKRSEAVENGRKGGLAKAEVSRKFEGSPAKVPQKSTRISHTTHSEINEMAIASPSPTPTPSPKEDSHQASVEQDAEGLAGLNGMAVSMIGDVQRWMVGGDERSARTWLANTSRTFGAEITKRAYQKLGTDMAEGNPIARPLQTWGAIAQRMKAEAQSPQAKKSALSIIAEMEARGEF